MYNSYVASILKRVEKSHRLHAWHVAFPGESLQSAQKSQDLDLQKIFTKI